MHATLHFQRGPLLALLAVFFLALMAALAPGLAELDLSGVAGGGSSEPGAVVSTAPEAGGASVWVGDPLEPPLASIERVAAGR
jgi:hypothetical protein